MIANRAAVRLVRILVAVAGCVGSVAAAAGEVSPGTLEERLGFEAILPLRSTSFEAPPIEPELIREWGETGPPVALWSGWSLQPALEVETVHYDAAFYSSRGAVRFSLENVGGGFFQGFDLALGVERFASDSSDDDGAFAELGVWLGSADLLTHGDWLQLYPGLNLADGRVSAARYGEAGLDLSYGVPLSERVSLEISGSSWYRRYAGRYDWEETAGARWDWTTSGALSFTLSPLFLDPLALELRTELERNWSDEAYGTYTEARAELFLELDF